MKEREGCKLRGTTPLCACAPKKAPYVIGGNNDDRRLVRASPRSRRTVGWDGEAFVVVSYVTDIEIPIRLHKNIVVNSARHMCL